MFARFFGSSSSSSSTTVESKQVESKDETQLKIKKSDEQKEDMRSNEDKANACRLIFKPGHLVTLYNFAKGYVYLNGEKAPGDFAVLPSTVNNWSNYFVSFTTKATKQEYAKRVKEEIEKAIDKTELELYSKQSDEEDVNTKFLNSNDFNVLPGRVYLALIEIEKILNEMPKNFLLPEKSNTKKHIQDTLTHYKVLLEKAKLPVDLNDEKLRLHIGKYFICTQSTNVYKA